MKNQDSSSSPKGNLSKEPMLRFNCWFDPNFDPAQSMLELQTQINGGYPYVDQTGFYLDPLSGEDWVYVSRQKEYSEIGRSISYSSTAELIGHILAEEQSIPEVDLIILGPGKANAEAILAQHMAPFFKKMRVFLVEASDTLLRRASRTITQAIGHMDHTEVLGIEGDFRNLWQYINLMSPSVAHRRRVIVAFTILYNLQDELHFIHNNFVQLEKGDLFLFDFWQTLGSIEEPEKIEKLEPRLAGTNPNAGWDQALDNWHKNILHKYCNDFDSVKFSYEFSMQGCPIPGSYSVDKLAHVRRKNGTEYTLIFQRYKRYDPEQLAYSLRREGLLPVNLWPSRKARNFSLYLFEKLNSPYKKELGSEVEVSI